jgi:transposase
MEATLFTGWVYDFLAPYAAALKVAHPAMLKAIAASKKKNDRVDAEKICDLLRVDLLPECHMADARTRQLRSMLRYRNLVVSLSTKMKNKMAGLLMEVGAPYAKSKLHRKRYFASLMDNLEDVPDTVRDLLRTSRAQLEMFLAVQRRLLSELERLPELRARVERLMTIKGVGPVTALTWALEVGDVARFASLKDAVSYCGLCSAQKESAGKTQRGPLSKIRNRHLQTVLIEAAKLAPRWHPALAALYEREAKRSHANRATVAVARKIVAYLLAVDRRETGFQKRPETLDAQQRPAA